MRGGHGWPEEVVGEPPDADTLGSFAVIHDEEYLAIVYEDGEFKGEVVDATLERLEYARAVAGQYNLDIVQVRCDHYRSFKLTLRERVVSRN